MIRVPAGSFLMSSDDFYPEERPVHEAAVDGFWIDEHEVTVADYRRFVNVKATETGAPGENIARCVIRS